MLQICANSLLQNHRCLIFCNFSTLFCDCFCDTTSLWSDIDSGTHFFRNVKKADLTTAQTSFNFSFFCIFFTLVCDCFCGATSLWSDIDSGTHFFRNVKKTDLATAQTSFNFSQNLRECRCGPWTHEFHLLTTFGDVFWGGRSQHSSDMFELLTQKSSVAETIKKPTRAPGSHTRTQQERVPEEAEIGHSSDIFALFTYFLGARPANYPPRRES